MVAIRAGIPGGLVKLNKAKKYNNKVAIVPLTIRLLSEFYKRMRPEDMAECLAGPDSRNFLDIPISDLVECGAQALVYDNNLILGIGGVHKGCIWLLCTTHVEKHKVAFLRYMKTLIPILRKYWKEPLYNHAWERNKLHIAWLKSLDAKFYKRQDGFLYFYWLPITSYRKE
nr:MAG TPA: hypothetical protein [Caudoviricetes sp.]